MIKTFLVYAQEDSIKILALLKAQNLGKETQAKHLIAGGVRMRLYPWTPVEFRFRSRELIDSARAELKHHSTKLQIQPSSISGGSISKPEFSESTCFGIFTKKNIRQGELVLSAPTIISSSGKPFATRCYDCHTSLLLKTQEIPL